MPSHPQARVELDAVVRSISFRAPSGEFAVAKLELPGQTTLFTAVGPLAAVSKGETVRLQGRWENDPKFGRQLKVDGWLPALPETSEGLVRFLGSGTIDGIGPELAQRLVDAFGLDTLDVLDHHPHRITEVDGIGSTRARKILAAWSSKRDARALMVLLRGHGIGAALAGKISQQYGSNALQVCRQDPYRLALEVPGVGFLTADNLARAQGIAANDPGRIAAGTHHFLAESTTSGHVALPETQLVQVSAERLSVDPDLVREALSRLHLESRVVLEELDQQRLVYLPPLHQAERVAAEALRQRLARKASFRISDVESGLSAFQAWANIELDPAQIEAVQEVLQHGIAVITGGPGTGKTTLIRALLFVLNKQNRKVKLAAPTGRAAKRMEEATGKKASTLHRLLEVDPKSGQFQRGPEAPIEADLVIVDEVSMVDLPLFASLLSALDQATPLVLVGDQDQLPSVGPGRVLADLLELEVPSVRLSKVFRQAEASWIVRNAYQVNQGKPLHRPPKDEGLTDFYLLERTDPEAAVSTLMELIEHRVPKRFQLGWEDIQVLVPMRKGTLGTEALNEALQDRLNPSAVTFQRGKQAFRPKDRVMQTRNDYELGVLNGEVGQVKSVDPKAKRVSVRFDEDTVHYEAKDLEHLHLAYACSIHKSQGSEYPAVIVVLGRQHIHMLDRQLLYTAMTRARKLLILIAEPGALRSASRPPRGGQRVSGLRTRLATGDRLQALDLERNGAPT